MDRAAVFFESVEVAIGIVGFAVFPAGEVNADEFKSQGAVGLVMMVVVFGFVVGVKVVNPRFP